MDFEEMRKHYSGKEWMMERINDLEIDLKMINTMAPYAGIQYIRKKVGYDDFLREHAEKTGISIEECFDELWNIEESSRAHASNEKWLMHIKEVMITLEKQEEKSKENKGVHLMTIHGSQGLEFDTVFILGVNEGSIPYRRGMKDNLEEERRLLYVAMTRAKEHLELTYVQEKNGNELRPSRFLEEIG
jgi:DNA helicase-2/ATP-dependent DNA helicase PcrA